MKRTGSEWPSVKRAQILLLYYHYTTNTTILLLYHYRTGEARLARRRRRGGAETADFGPNLGANLTICGDSIVSFN